MKINHKKISISKQVLYCLSEILGRGVKSYWELMPSKINRKLWGSPESYSIEERFQHERQIKRALYEMKKRKLLEIKSVGEKIFCGLTDKGGQEAVLVKTKFKKINSKGEYCLVCFDIPEAVHYVRWALRRFLKTADFELLQKSVWFTNKDVFDEIQEYIKSLKVGKWVTVIRAKFIDKT